MAGGNHVRAAGPEDVDRVAELWADLVDHHVLFDPRYERVAGSEAAFARYLRGKLYDVDSLLLVAEVDGEVVGFANAQLANYPPCFARRAHGHLDNLAIAPGHQRRGLGSALLEKVMAWFAGKGVPTVEGRVHLSNPAAVAFWQTTGFAPYMQIIRASTQVPK